MTEKSIIFPGPGITIESVGRSISIFGFEIAYYGLVIVVGMLVALLFISWNAKRYGESKDVFYDMTIFGIVCGVIGARAYYVIFSWDMYKDDLISILNIRNGGLAIFGGIIAGAFAVFIFSKKKKIPFFKSGDIVIPGVLIGQIFGRWGNFFNREAFGGYSNGFLRMLLPVNSVRSYSDITDTMMEFSESIDGVEFISVHPTFLYESLWNLGILILILILTRKPRFYGFAMGVYFFLYGVGRFFIESLRTDQLLVPGTNIPVSMAVSLVSIVFALVIFLRGTRNREVNL